MHNAYRIDKQSTWSSLSYIYISSHNDHFLLFFTISFNHFSWIFPERTVCIPAMYAQQTMLTFNCECVVNVQVVTECLNREGGSAWIDGSRHYSCSHHLGGKLPVVLKHEDTLIHYIYTLVNIILKSLNLLQQGILHDPCIMFCHSSLCHLLHLCIHSVM